MKDRLRSAIDRVTEQIGECSHLGDDDPFIVQLKARRDAMYEQARTSDGPGHPTEIVAQSKED